MKDDSRSNFDAFKTFICIVLMGWIIPILVMNAIQMPDDGSLVWRTALISFLIVTLWFFFLRNKINVLSILFACILISTAGATFVGWTENFLNGNPSYGVIIREIIGKYWFHFLMIVVGTFLGTESGKIFLIKTGLFILGLFDNI